MHIRIIKMAAAGMAALLLLNACGGESKNETAKGPKLGDCEYSDKVELIIDNFQRNVGEAVAELTGDTATATEKEDAKKAISVLDRELGKAISDLKALNVDGEISSVNQELVGGLEDFKKRLPEATQAAERGEMDRIESVLEKGGQDFSNRFSDLDKRFPDAASRLGKCQ